MKLVLANGCFDPLHPGHVEHLEAAATFGSRLIVALTVDEVVRYEKGERRPYLNWDERAMMLRALRCVDMVVRSDNAWSSIRRYRPEVFVKGSDWKDRMLGETEKACAEVGARLVYTETPRFGVGELVRRITG